MTTEQKAIELLKTRIDTMEIHINEGRDVYSYEDITDFIKAAEFLNEVAGSTYNIRTAQKYLDSL